MAQEAGLREREAAGGRHPPPMLAGFAKYLEEAGLLEFCVTGRRGGGEGDDSAMDSRIRLHALVLLANRLGLGAPYECDEYNFGPRSTSLAEDARALSGRRAGLYDGVPASVPDSFRREEFEGLVEGRDTEWLAAASTLADMRAYRSTRERLMDTVRDDDLAGRRPTYPRERVSSILGELERAGLVTAYA